MTGRLIPEDPGLLTSILRYIDRPGQVVRNVLHGNLEGAARQAGDILGDTLDAPLPGDWFPTLSRPEDDVDTSELVGGMEPGLGKFAVDLVGNTLTDPLTYVGGSVIKGALKGAKALTEKLPTGAQKALETTGRNVRSVFGAQRISPETRAILDRAKAAGANEARAGVSAIKGGVLGTLDEGEAGIVSDIMDNMRWENGKALPLATAPDATLMGASSVPDALARVALHPEVTPANAERIRQAVSEAIAIGKSQKARPNIFSDVRSPTSTDIGYGVSSTNRNGATLGGGLSDEYLARQWKGQTEEQKIAEALGAGPSKLGSPSAVKELKLDTPELVNAHIEANPGVTFERNAVQRLGQRAESQGMLAQRAEIGKALVGEKFAYADDEMRGLAMKAIEEIAQKSPEDAQALLNGFKGLGQRGAFMDALAKTNKIFKPAAVYGFVLPKIGSIVRNKISGVWQALSNPESRGTALSQAARIPSDLAGAVSDGLGLTLGKGKLGEDLAAIDMAFTRSAGSAENATAALEQAGRRDLADMVRSGALDGFVTSEQLVQDMARTPMTKKLWNIADTPGRMFRGIEDRMRAGMYLDLVGKGKTPQEAARIVRDSLYDYSASSVGNRTARDFIPFFQFAAKAIPQQAKLLAEKPAVGVALAQVMGGNDDPVYPWMQGKTNIPIGDDQDGNAEYITGFGLPFETLNNLPNPSADLGEVARQVESGIVGSSHPLLKSAFAAVSGEDPYFQTPYGSYDKIPGVGEAGDAGRAYNKLAGTGMIQPLDSILRVIGDATDDRHSLPEKALDMLTGVNIASVDEDRALQQLLQNYLQANPEVQQYRSLYTRSEDPALGALLDELKAAKARAKAKPLP